MDTTVIPRVGSEHITFGEDLASLACNAAIELDNLLIGQAPTLDSVRKLAHRLTRELPTVVEASGEKHLIDPSTIVVMSRVIRDSTWLRRPSHIQDLTQTAGNIAQQLLSVSDSRDTTQTDTSSLEQLRTFCLTLSKRAAAARGSAVETKPPHPYRKQG